MADKKQQAAELLRQFKGDNFIFGLDCFNQLGKQAASFGKRVSLVTVGMEENWAQPIHQATRHALDSAAIELAGDPIPGAAPNSPKDDVFRIAQALSEQQPEVVICVGGGSNIDATKAAVTYLTLGDKYPEFNNYFGMGQVSKMLDQTNRRLLPMVAVQLASGSGAHLTKYSNITDMQTMQKLLIIDEAVVPPKALFDYKATVSMSRAFTMDGGLDGVSHCLEVYMGIPADQSQKVKPVSLLGIDLIVNNLKAACRDPQNLGAREAIGLGTDLGGYAIMIGGTNGAHLTSFSLVDLLPHGRACALMNPYYTVFFAPAIENRLRDIGTIYKNAGYTDAVLDSLRGRDLGLAVAEAMLELSKDIGFPTTLDEVTGFTDTHIERALAAAKNPKLESKLKNMPVPLTAQTVDDYMGPILAAAKTGDFGRIKNMS
ncbi:MAG: iron-containing alcohol dehydrogenase [Planctomycetota bacterium]|nr:MAG: iron-containing alcohol dehydrogenase [Planctomycetota bacterium]